MQGGSPPICVICEICGSAFALECLKQSPFDQKDCFIPVHPIYPRQNCSFSGMVVNQNPVH